MFPAGPLNDARSELLVNYLSYLPAEPTVSPLDLFGQQMFTECHVCRLPCEVPPGNLRIRVDINSVLDWVVGKEGFLEEETLSGI